MYCGSCTSPPVQSAGSPYASRGPVRPVARIRSHEESNQSALTLKVKTAEGDTVELSIDATSLKQTETGTASTPNGTATASTASESDSLNFKVKVQGNLSDQEVTDITKLIQSLASGQPIDSPLTSLSSFQGSYAQTSSVKDSTFALYA